MDVHLDLCFDTCPENLISVPVIESQHVPWRHLHTEMLHPLEGRLTRLLFGPRIPSPRNLTYFIHYEFCHID